MPSTEPVRATNRLIRSLPRGERVHFLTHCKPVQLGFAAVIAEPGDRLRKVYFPTAGFISMVMPVDTHDNLEVGLVGDEGMLGASLVLGVEDSPLRALVQGEGVALCMDARRFRTELEGSGALRQVFHRYLHVLMCQLAQSAACARYHLLEARLARWLLMTQDRAHADHFHITHEYLAFMLGVRRVGVTKAATALHEGNLINYHRGDIVVLDRGGLEAAACSCYAADSAIYARTMTGVINRR